jgi:hypothetical protein
MQGREPFMGDISVLRDLVGVTTPIVQSWTGKRLDCFLTGQVRQALTWGGIVKAPPQVLGRFRVSRPGSRK